MTFMGKTIDARVDSGADAAYRILHNAQCVIFDLDGTLVNTIDDLALACEILIKKHGFDFSWSIEDYKNFVGNGALLLVKRAFADSLGERELQEIYAEFKTVYNRIKLDHAHIYKNMDIVLNALRQNGFKLAVCTNKPDAAAAGMVKSLFGAGVFDIVRGAVDSKPKKPDPTVAGEILTELSVPPEKAVWIGDSDVDVRTAQNLGCKSIGASWGFRPAESLVNAGADVLIGEPLDILKIFKIDIDNI